MCQDFIKEQRTIYQKHYTQVQSERKEVRSIVLIESILCLAMLSSYISL